MWTHMETKLVKKHRKGVWEDRGRDIFYCWNGYDDYSDYP